MKGVRGGVAWRLLRHSFDRDLVHVGRCGRAVLGLCPGCQGWSTIAGVGWMSDCPLDVVRVRVAFRPRLD